MGGVWATAMTGSGGVLSGVGLRSCLCANCNGRATLGPTLGIWHCSGDEWDDTFDELCVTCVMLLVKAAKVNRLATASGLGLAWDYVRGYYAREALEMAKRETRRWYLILILADKPFSTWTMFGPQFSPLLVRVLTFVVGPEPFLQEIDACPGRKVPVTWAL